MPHLSRGGPPVSLRCPLPICSPLFFCPTSTKGTPQIKEAPVCKYMLGKHIVWGMCAGITYSVLCAHTRSNMRSYFVPTTNRNVFGPTRLANKMARTKHSAKAGKSALPRQVVAALRSMKAMKGSNARAFCRKFQVIAIRDLRFRKTDVSNISVSDTSSK